MPILCISCSYGLFNNRFSVEDVSRFESDTNELSPNEIEVERDYHYKKNEHAVFAKISLLTIHQEAVFYKTYKRECILTDVRIDHDYFAHVEDGTTITIPIYSDYFEYHNKTNRVNVRNDLESVLETMDVSYIYLGSLVLENYSPHSYFLDDGSYFSSSYPIPNDPFSICFYRNLIYMLNNKLNEQSIKNIILKNAIYEIEDNPWDTDRFVDGKTREEIEIEINKEVIYANN